MKQNGMRSKIVQNLEPYKIICVFRKVLLKVLKNDNKFVNITWTKVNEMKLRGYFMLKKALILTKHPN
jgi:hypothetical protein